MPACASETIAPLWPSPHFRGERWMAERARAGSSSSSSCSSSSESSGGSRPGSPADWTPCSEPQSLLSRLLGWYPALVLRLAKQMLSVALFLAWSQIFLSTGLWLLDVALQVPLAIAKWVLSAMYGSRGLGRTVIITGSSIETLQAARNFYQAGARVVIVEHDNSFGLVKFSTAVQKFYKVPPPQKYLQDYIREICRIAERENAAYFVPTSTSHAAYYDALAKPHLEQLGVVCICAGAKEVCLMDDPSAMLQLCHDAGLPTPVHYRVTTPEQLTSLYEDGQLRRARHVFLNAGPFAARDIQHELELPQTRRGFRRLVQTQPKCFINLCATRPAVVIQIPEGERLVTCTTVRDGRVCANVTCRAPLPGEDTPLSLEPIVRDDVTQWLDTLMTALPSRTRSFTGHLKFNIISTRNGLVPISCRFGMSLPYLCYTTQQPRLLLKPCRHHQHTPALVPDQSSLVIQTGRYWVHNIIRETLTSPGVGKTFTLLHTLARKHEALFTPWDPIPCCVYYGLQLPASTVLKLLQGTKKVNSTTVQHSVHFSNVNSISTLPAIEDTSVTKLAHVCSNINNNNYKNGSILRSVSTFSPIPEDCGAVTTYHKNGYTNGTTVRKNGFTTNGHVIPSGDLIQL